uniref:Uncharacterized protein n=1 Tax=Arundo donax TaxID=35708 RepID=A0A0A9DUD2_ARUDO
MTFCSLAEWDKIVSLQGKFLIILSIVLTSMLMNCSFALFTLLDSLSEATSLDNDFLGGDNNSLISDILANNSLVSFITPWYEGELISLTSESNSSDDSGKIEAIISKRCFRDMSFIAK